MNQRVPHKFRRRRSKYLTWLILAVACLGQASQSSGGVPTEVLSIAQGQLRGLVEEDVEVFRGIPFAVPPVASGAGEIQATRPMGRCSRLLRVWPRLSPAECPSSTTNSRRGDQVLQRGLSQSQRLPSRLAHQPEVACSLLDTAAVSAKERIPWGSTTAPPSPEKGLLSW